MVANGILTSSFLLEFFSIQVHVIPLSLYFFSGHRLAGGDVSDGEGMMVPAPGMVWQWRY